MLGLSAVCVVVSRAQAPAPAAPNLALIRRNTTISDVDRQNVQRWVNERVTLLFTSHDLDVDAVQVRSALLEHYQASDATPSFRQLLSATFIDGVSRSYRGKTSATDPSLPRPLPVVYALVMLVLFDDPAALPVYRQAMLDASDPPAPGIRAVALEGLIRQRDRMNAQTWTAVVADAERLAADETDPLVLARIYRFLAAETPEPRAQEGLSAVLRTLEGRLNRFERQGHMPSLAERDAAVWLATRVRATQNAQHINEMARQLGRLLADAAFAYTRAQTPPAHKENLEMVVIAAEEALKAIATARAPGQAQPDVSRVVLAGGADHAKRISDEVNKWIGTANAPGVLNRAPFNLPAGLNIQRVVSAEAAATTTTTAAPG